MVSDTDRDAVVRDLIRHCGDGRLTLDELEDRVGEAYAATTGIELRLALRELPPFRHEPVDAIPAAGAPAVPVARPRGHHRRGEAHRRCRRRRMARPPLFLVPLVVVISHLAR